MSAEVVAIIAFAGTLIVGLLGALTSSITNANRGRLDAVCKMLDAYSKDNEELRKRIVVLENDKAAIALTVVEQSRRLEAQGVQLAQQADKLAHQAVDLAAAARDLAIQAGKAAEQSRRMADQDMRIAQLTRTNVELSKQLEDMRAKNREMEAMINPDKTPGVPGS
jgi:predicted  nucleic acid-binding Zn-ribbon protein